MGLDIALGVITLLWAIRGYFKGFLRQAIQLAALVGCVYLADPVRDLARPYALDYLPAIEPALLDKLLWWTAAVLSYVVTSGFALSIVRVAQRRSDPDEDVRRGDSGLGFLLGALKGLILACFLAWGLTTHSSRYVETGGWAGEQVQTSRLLKLSEEHRPAERLWRSEPVQNFVAHIRVRGLRGGEPADATRPERNAEPGPSRAEMAQPARSSSAPPPERVARRPEPLKIPQRPLRPGSPDFLDEFDAALKDVERAAGRAGKSD